MKAVDALIIGGLVEAGIFAAVGITFLVETTLLGVALIYLCSVAQRLDV